MAKTIIITNVDLKQFDTSCIDGKINIRLSYSLLDADGKEYDCKSGMIKDEELTQAQKNYINTLITGIETKLKQREEI